MKKLTAYAILWITLVALATPWLTGVFFKQLFLASLSNIQDSRLASVKLRSYHIGWLESKASLEITPKSPTTNSNTTVNPVRITVNKTITHGPFIYNKTNKQLTIGLAGVDTQFQLPRQNTEFHASLGAFQLNGSLTNLFTDQQLQLQISVNTQVADKLAAAYFQETGIPTDTDLTPPSLIPSTTSQVHAETFNNQMAGLMKRGKLSPTLAIQIMLLRNQDLTPAQFTKGLESLFKLSPNMLAKVSRLYRKSYLTHTKLPKATANTVLQQWVKTGYLKQDNQRYILSTTKNKHRLTVN